MPIKKNKSTLIFFLVLGLTGSSYCMDIGDHDERLEGGEWHYWKRKDQISDLWVRYSFDYNQGKSMPDNSGYWIVDQNTKKFVPCRENQEKQEEKCLAGDLGAQNE